ncbi:uncharacterized protein LOC113461671 isoform X2 [Phoenix dactylifera]|uniref:Uncharacterized protein LOC113461671 isoform X2 n=1 Tax=Phoenix dactylifera TaxID=42345 RepID=A0A8B8ZLP6_PHODC|nr:uncharacterized protein LOC113461671 isoform X2 [Phoenix dactylifera]
MELSRKLEACEQKRRSLQDQLSELERCWKPLSVLFELRDFEALEIHRSLQNCLEKKNAVDKRYAELTATIIETPSRLRFLHKGNKDMENQINTAAAIVESLRRNNEKKRIDLLITENKVEGFSEMKRRLLMQLSGQRYCQRAETQASTSASAKGK